MTCLPKVNTNFGGGEKFLARQRVRPGGRRRSPLGCAPAGCGPARPVPAPPPRVDAQPDRAVGEQRERGCPDRHRRAAGPEGIQRRRRSHAAGRDRPPADIGEPSYFPPGRCRVWRAVGPPRKTPEPLPVVEILRISCRGLWILRLDFSMVCSTDLFNDYKMPLFNGRKTKIHKNGMPFAIPLSQDSPRPPESSRTRASPATAGASPPPVPRSRDCCCCFFVILYSGLQRKHPVLLFASFSS